MWSSQSPAVAQEVGDVRRGRRVLLSLSTPGNGQPDRARRTRAKARASDGGIPSEHVQGAGLVLPPPSLPPQTSVLGNESQKLAPSPNYDGLRMRLYRRCCYFRCVRKVKVPEVVTRYRCLSKVPSLVLHHLTVVRRLHRSDSRHLDTICVDVNRGDIKPQHPTLQ